MTACVQTVLTCLLFGAAGLFGQLQDALNTIWEVRPKPGRGVWGYLRDRFLSLSMVLGVAFLLLVSLIASSALAAFGQLLGDWQTGSVGLVITTLLDLVVITILFALIYRYLPDAEIAWRDVWLGLGSIAGTAAKYLAARGCAIPSSDGDLRCTESLRHPSGYLSLIHI